jgi:hypothetical protein
MPDDFFDTPSAKEVAEEAMADAAAREERKKNETDEQKRERLEREQREARARTDEIREFQVYSRRVANINLELNKDNRLDSLSSALVKREIDSLIQRGASQVTQVNTETIVQQNTIIIYQNERIIELLQGLQPSS